MDDILALVAVTAFLAGIIIIPLTVFRVFKGSEKQFADVFKQAARQQDKARESTVFKLAESQGAVTAYQVTQHTDLTLVEATEYLEELVKAGALTMEVLDSGAIEYRVAVR